MPENKHKIDPPGYPESEQEGADEDDDLGRRPQRGRDRDNEVKPSKTEDVREDELAEHRDEDEDADEDEDEDEVTSRQPRLGE